MSDRDKTREQVLARVLTLPAQPVAIEALWDGDTQGWYVYLSAVLATKAGFEGYSLGSFKDGGDIRLFNGQVPPWSEALQAQAIGTEIAEKFGIPFYFPSPNHPEDDCPHWWEREQSYPCRRCQMPLLQSKSTPWRGLCYHCHLEEKQEKREAAWTPEERLGPKCEMCGSPAKGLLGISHLCQTCLEKYVDFECSVCGTKVRTSTEYSGVCSSCELKEKLASIPEENLQAIRLEYVGRGELSAIRLACNLLGLSLSESMHAVYLISER